MQVVYRSAQSNRYFFRSGTIETQRAERFGLELVGYTHKTLSIPADLAESKRVRADKESGL